VNILTSAAASVRARSGRSLAPWQVELRDALRDPERLCEALDLPPEIARTACTVARQFSLLVPASYLSRIERGNPADPLLRQVLPIAQERADISGFTSDPVGDGAAIAAPGLLQKYAGRALLIVTGACAVHCRYCFRREFPYDELTAPDAAWSEALKGLTADDSIEEVILSGGDPLTLTDRRLALLADRLAEIAHVKRLRVHTRLPIVIPSRVTDALLGWLTGTRLTPIMVLHANHARELDAAVAFAAVSLRRAGFLLLNHAVLLRGFNDSADAQCDLSLRLVDLGVTPYYLHQLDRVRGAAHFEVPVSRSREIIAEMRRRLPGYAVPRYVHEQPGAAHKIALD
jgi:EF-P beta-lysylation protein EpmB